MRGRRGRTTHHRPSAQGLTTPAMTTPRDSCHPAAAALARLHGWQPFRRDVAGERRTVHLAGEDRRYSSLALKVFEHPDGSSKPLGMHAPVLSTPRLTLRAPEEADLERWAALMSDPDASRWIGGPLPQSSAWRSMASIAGSWSLRGHGMFSVVDRSGRWLGRVGPWMPEGWPGREIGWALHPDAQGEATPSRRRRPRSTGRSRCSAGRTSSTLSLRKTAGRSCWLKGWARRHRARRKCRSHMRTASWSAGRRLRRNGADGLILDLSPNHIVSCQAAAA